MFLFLLIGMIACGQTIESADETDDRFITKIVNLEEEDLKLYWADENDDLLKNFANLSAFLKNQDKELSFAMNGGMFKRDFSPQGLFIENGKTIAPLDTLSGKGNFYLQPNGVFYLTTDNQAIVTQTSSFKKASNIKFATQSGPMLIIDGDLHPAFNEGSSNLHIRNGVGILENNQVVFAMSKEKINFFDFAKYFQKMGCKNALYLDGFVSRTYYPAKNWVQNDGNFGVMIGVSEK